MTTHSRRVAVAGEVLTDLVPARDGLFSAAPGGSPANVAVGLARLGVPTTMLARLADDALGRRLRNHLEVNGVDLSRVVKAPEESSLAIVTLDEHGGADYDFRVAGTADWQWTDEELVAAVDDGVSALHVGSLAMTMEPGTHALRRLVERGRRTATISFDPNLRPLLMGSPDTVRPLVEQIVALADVVKASADDVEWLYPGQSVDDVVAAWHRSGPALVAVTLGADGVVGVGRAAGPVRRPGVRVDVVDTVGAGDSFMSALIAGLYRRGVLGADARVQLSALPGDDVAALLDEAVRASAVTCSRQGADPPTAEELARR